MDEKIKQAFKMWFDEKSQEAEYASSYTDEDAFAAGYLAGAQAQQERDAHVAKGFDRPYVPFIPAPQKVARDIADAIRAQTVTGDGAAAESQRI